MIKEIATNWRPSGMRWTVYRFPSGHVERVLQQQWVREVTTVQVGGASICTFENRWEDVPNHEMLYEPTK